MVNGAKLAKYNVIVTTNTVLHNYIKLQNIRYKSMNYRGYNQLKDFFINYYDVVLMYCNSVIKCLKKYIICKK
jgi:hypothetical protein